ncbi:MAG: alpha/beta hydrolase [Pseudomonadales bacterium]
MWLFCLYLVLLLFGYWVPSSLAWMRWTALAGALWVLTCAVGLLVPFWVVLPATAIIGCSDYVIPKRLAPRLRVFVGVLIHLSIFGLFASFSIDQPPLWLPVVVALGHTLLATLIGPEAPRFRPLHRRSVLVAMGFVCVVAASLLIFNWDRTSTALSRIQLTSIPFASLRAVSTPTLEQLPLTPGIAWQSVVKPADNNSCALVLHGADPNGARQAASQSLIAALHELDTYVVAIDHPGYGLSPVPDGDTVQAWDPGALTEAAYAHLERSQCAKVTVFGHSMGASEALRLAASNKAPNVASIKLLGAGVFEGTTESDNYWYKRFHQDRGLDHNSVPFELWKRIMQAYYHNGHLAEALPERNRSAIEFYVYDQENPDLAITRETLWQILDKPRRINLPMSHYFNAVSFGPVLLLDSRAISQAKRSLSSVNAQSTLIAGTDPAVAQNAESITRAAQ